MVFEAYPDQQRDMRWITVVLTSVATLLLGCRLIATVRNRGFLGLEDAFVIAANVSSLLPTPKQGLTSPDMPHSARSMHLYVNDLRLRHTDSYDKSQWR